MQPKNQSDQNASTNTNDTSSQPPIPSGGQRVIQPRQELIEELRAQQEEVVSPLVDTNAPQSTQSNTPLQSVYPQTGIPTNNQMQASMSASQIGWNQSSSKKSFNGKKLIIKSLAGLVVVGGVFALLVFMDIIALSEFKTLSYTNSKGTNFHLTFYTRHSTQQLQSGENQLVSKVSKDDKLPLTLSISNTTNSGYARAKDCASFTKVFDVQNSALNQTISVCDFGKQNNLPAGSVYIAGITQNNMFYIITIGQDYSGVDLSSPSGAQQSLSRFGLDSYQDDLKTIISSIKTE